MGIRYDESASKEWQHEVLEGLQLCQLELEMELVDAFKNRSNNTNKFVHIDGYDTLDTELKRKNIKETEEMKQLKLWCTQELKLPKYYPLFIEHGVEDLETVGLLGVKELEEIGIRKLGHKTKILHLIGIENISAKV